MSFSELKKLLGDNHFEFAKMQYVTHRVHQSETYGETVHSVEKLADASFRLFAEKPKHEQAEILARMDELSKKINEIIDKESPLVVALALLTAIPVHEQLVKRDIQLSRQNLSLVE